MYQVPGLLGTISNVNEVANGSGQHIRNLTSTQRSGYAKWGIIGQTQFVISTGLIKLSVCFFVLRLVSRTRKALRHCIYVLMGFVVVSTVGLVIALLVRCRPLAALYNPQVKGNCYSVRVVIYVAYVQGGMLL